MGDTDPYIHLHKGNLPPGVTDRALAAITDPLCVINADFHIVWANEAFTALHSTSLETILGKYCYQISHSKDAICRECPAKESFETARPCRSEQYVQGQDGRDHWNEVRTWPIYDENANVALILECISDITKRKREEEALSREAAINAAIAELCSALVSLASSDEIASLVLNSARRLTGSKHGYVCYVDRTTGSLVSPAWTTDILKNPGAEGKKAIFKEFRGLRNWVLSNRKSLMTNSPEKDPRSAGVPPSHFPIRRLLSVPALIGEKLVGQITLANSDQDYTAEDLVLVERLAAVYAIAVERKEALDTIIRAKENWEKTFDAISDSVMLLDKEGRIVLANRATSKMLEAGKESLIGKYCGEAVHGTTQPVKQCPLLRTISTLMPGTREITELSLGGTFICSAAPIFDHDGNLAGYTNTLRDVTEPKRLEAQLQHAQKMTAIGTLAGGIAHDFNNILQAISGYTQLLLMRKSKDDSEYNYLDQIDRSTQRAAELVRQLLLFSQQVESKVKLLDLNQIIKHVIKLLQRTVPKMISIEPHLAKNLKKINADPVQLEQVIMNLALNAKDAMPDGGRLTIRTENMDQVPCTEDNPSGHVLLTISDTGIGMDPRMLERIFEPFYTTKETGKGTGLGLAMVYGIVKSHGGHTSCESQPGHGTAFKISFPAADSPVPDRNEARNQRIKTSKGNEVILLADDDTDLLDIGKDFLTQQGYTVITVENGEKAIEVYKSEGSHIDLIVLDIGMPGMGGQRCMQELVRMNPKIRIILASGYAPDVAPTKTGFESAVFLAKPYRLTDLLAKIREVLDNE